MGCTASVVQLQALRSLMRSNCARTCSDRQEQISLEVLQSLDSELDSRPRTIIITVIRFCSFVVWFRLGGTAKIHSDFVDLFMSAISGRVIFAIAFLLYMLGFFALGIYSAWLTKAVSILALVILGSWFKEVVHHNYQRRKWNVYYGVTYSTGSCRAYLAGFCVGELLEKYGERP